MDTFSLSTAMQAATDLLAGAWACVTSNPLGVSFIGLTALGIGMSVFHKIKHA